LRIFKNSWFRRLARRQKITDKALREAVARAEKGAVDAISEATSLNSALPGRVRGNLAGTGQSSFLKRAIGLFLFMGLQKANG